MKLDQVAYCCRTDEEAALLKEQLGLTQEEWIVDRVTAMGFVKGHSDEEVNIALLQFCDKLGVQFEIIRYLRGANWLENEPHKGPFIAHIGYHLDEGEEFPPMPYAELVQEVMSKSHTCEYLTTGAAAGRKYHYQIWKISPHTYVKFIKRIHPVGGYK